MCKYSIRMILCNTIGMFWKIVKLKKSIFLHEYRWVHLSLEFTTSTLTLGYWCMFVRIFHISSNYDCCRNVNAYGDDQCKSISKCVGEIQGERQLRMQFYSADFEGNPRDQDGVGKMWLQNYPEWSRIFNRSRRIKFHWIA